MELSKLIKIIGGVCFAAGTALIGKAAYKGAGSIAADAAWEIKDRTVGHTFVVKKGFFRKKKVVKTKGGRII